MDKPLKYSVPDDILLNGDVVKNSVIEYLNWKEPETQIISYKQSTISFVADMVLAAIAIVPIWTVTSTLAKIISIILLVVLLIFIAVNGTKWYETYKSIRGVEKKALDENLIERAKEKIIYTGIARITYKQKNETIYLIGKDYFLPHCNLDKNRTIIEQKEILISSLKEKYGIKGESILDITPIDNIIHYSIKPIHGTIKMNAYVFYDVTIKIQYKDKITNQNTQRRWATITQMKNNTTAMSTNKDVIELLDDFPAPTDSFVNILGDIKIIWNITNKCPYKCAICATHDESRKELDLNQKIKIMNNINTAKQMIKNLDFAGGDPLCLDDNITVIQTAIGHIGKEKVSITTTGKSLSKLSKDIFPTEVYHCEITLDASHQELQSSEAFNASVFARNEDDYSQTNIENINLISSYADSLTINVPIINDNLTDKEIDNLILKINSIKNHIPGIDMDVSLIRLMPVGKLHANQYKDTYKNYNPISVASKIQSKLKEINIDCKLHCSLRVLPTFNDNLENCHCNMFENKIGIDCEGNVFACAWGGYLKNVESPIKNPFYLGNLQSTKLIDILTGKSKNRYYNPIFNAIENKAYRNYCSVISYYFNKDCFNNFDPLSVNTSKNNTK